MPMIHRELPKGKRVKFYFRFTSFGQSVSAELYADVASYHAGQYYLIGTSGACYVVPLDDIICVVND